VCTSPINEVLNLSFQVVPQRKQSYLGLYWNWTWRWRNWQEVIPSRQIQVLNSTTTTIFTTDINNKRWQLTRETVIAQFKNQQVIHQWQKMVLESTKQSIMGEIKLKERTEVCNLHFIIDRQHLLTFIN